MSESSWRQRFEYFARVMAQLPTACEQENYSDKVEWGEGGEWFCRKMEAIASDKSQS